VKITGANFDSKGVEAAAVVPKVQAEEQQQHGKFPGLPVRSSKVKVEGVGMEVGTVAKGADAVASSSGIVAGAPTPEVGAAVCAVDDATSLESSSPESSDDDEDLLDLLVDTLDGEFDPDLMI